MHWLVKLLILNPLTQCFAFHQKPKEHPGQNITFFVPGASSGKSASNSVRKVTTKQT